ncbi:MAG TPA: universal stress protein, partial [Gemmatimonadaceae bacterium]
SPVDTPAIGIRALKSAPVVVATDARAQSDGALVAGRIFAGDRAGMRVLTVVNALPMVSPEAGLPYSADVDASRRADHKRAAIEQIHRVLPDESGIGVEVYDGDPASRIVDIAHEANASLIVVGIGRHRVVDRVFGDETALRVARKADVPVLAVSGGASGAPRQVVVAVDFSETSLRAARLAIDLAAPEATIHLVHVEPRDAAAYEWPATGGEYHDDAGYALSRIRDLLRPPEGMSVRRVLLYGDAGTELLAFATSVHADLIATGSRGHGRVAQMLIGSVATRILRGATCSVLTVPYRATMTHGRPVLVPAAKSPPMQDWTAELDAFTKRNIGRRGVLEVDDLEIGAQAQEHDYPLLGATFDPHDRRVELMFGEVGSVACHLTRSIGNVTRIDVLRDDGDHDVALRIAHGSGQTLLTFAG